ncbi:MAG TPA: hypothetical protein VMT35_05010 [Ignavibacteriaceae bacterium]|nr:hypothetical protein [Ignavibacteriaceae bacterium]
MKNKHPHNPPDFLNEVEKSSGTKLNCKAELLLVLAEAEKNNGGNAFEDLIFTAKYITGLMKINKSSPEISEEDKDYMKKDFSANLQKVIALIKEIISSSEDKVKAYFEEKFFILTKESLISMNELLADLDKIESYLNYYKRKRMS